ncbi:MAG: hypothetical protein CME62_09115 [Halobacteriovoraceae bacterium]|nr:hypothetical protein [Halobacteriovoraceae bacterium]|tara:strand:+ start:7958 stop:8779 length:822 start_codon:yes stop_codon:yes gene_type:complete
MKLLFVAPLFIALISCSSFKNPREIKQGHLDGLKYESLKRYDAKRLGEPLKSKDPLALCHRGEFENAEKIFKEKLDKNLNNYIYWNQISTCYILKKEYNKAKNYLDLALNAAKKDEQKAVVLNNFGVVQMETKNFIEAKEYFKKSIELSKKYMTPKYNLSQIYLKHGLYGKAEDQLTELMHKNDKDIDFLNSMGHLKLMQKDYNKSLRFFEQIPQEYQSRDDVATNMAMTYYMLGKLEMAKKTLDNSDKDNGYYTSAQLEMSKKIEKQLNGGR